MNSQKWFPISKPLEETVENAAASRSSSFLPIIVGTVFKIDHSESICFRFHTKDVPWLKIIVSETHSAINCREQSSRRQALPSVRSLFTPHRWRRSYFKSSNSFGKLQTDWSSLKIARSLSLRNLPISVGRSVRCLALDKREENKVYSRIGKVSGDQPFDRVIQPDRFFDQRHIDLMQFTEKPSNALRYARITNFWDDQRLSLGEKKDNHTEIYSEEVWNQEGESPTDDVALELYLFNDRGARELAVSLFCDTVVSPLSIPFPPIRPLANIPRSPRDRSSTVHCSLPLSIDYYTHTHEEHWLTSMNSSKRPFGKIPCTRGPNFRSESRVHTTLSINKVPRCFWCASP